MDVIKNMIFSFINVMIIIIFGIFRAQINASKILNHNYYV